MDDPRLGYKIVFTSAHDNAAGSHLVWYDHELTLAEETQKPQTMTSATIAFKVNDRVRMVKKTDPSYHYPPMGTLGTITEVYPSSTTGCRVDWDNKIEDVYHPDSLELVVSAAPAPVEPQLFEVWQLTGFVTYGDGSAKGIVFGPGVEAKKLKDAPKVGDFVEKSGEVVEVIRVGTHAEINNVHARHLKPSTKEAFDEQKKRKAEEEAAEKKKQRVAAAAELTDRELLDIVVRRQAEKVASQLAAPAMAASTSDKE